MRKTLTDMATGALLMLGLLAFVFRERIACEIPSPRAQWAQGPTPLPVEVDNTPAAPIP